MMRNLVKSGKKVILASLIFVIAILLFACSEKNINEKNATTGTKINPIIIKKNENEVLFGSFYQNDDKTKEPIKWLVLDRDEKNKKALLLTKYLMDYHEFEPYKNGDLTWEKSDIRSYLQKDFFEEIFDKDNKSSISDSELGKIFLLSIDDVEKYNLGVCHPTRYAENLNVEMNNVYTNEQGWWLRSDGAGKNNLSYVDYAGKINYVGALQNAKYIYLRPAIWVNYEESVTSDASAKDKNKKINDNNNGIPIGSVGDIVKIGQYESDEIGKKTDIEWIIINKDEDNNKALVLSRYGIEYKKYSNFELKNDSHGNVIEPTANDAVTWETSPLRLWLNSDFYNTSFNEDEKKYIIDSEIKAEDDVEYGVNAGNDTIDKIFLLSSNEVKENIKNKNWLKCMPSKLPREKIQKNSRMHKKNGASMWWLRDPGYNSVSTKMIDTVGEIFANQQFYELLVRPAMWINYKNKEAEKLKSDASVLRLGDEGSVVGFGKYQNGNYDPYLVKGKKEKIIWKVQYKDPIENKALLVTEQIIDLIPYNNTSEAANWDNSYVRAWLNQHFYDEVFNDEEKKKIIKTKLDNTNRGSTGKKCKDTEDNVFLLSCEDILLYFEDGNISADVTNYGIFKGLTSKEVNKRDKIYRGTYMLRNTDETNHIPYAVFPEEYFDCKNDRYTAYEEGIRPAVWVRYEDTDKDLSYIYEPWGFETLILNLFYGDSDVDAMPLTDNFLKKHKNSLLDEYKIEFAYGDGGYLECNINEEDKTFVIDVKKNIYDEVLEYSIDKSVQTMTFDYSLDDNEFLDDIQLKKNVINGEEPGKINETDGPGKEIETTTQEKKETKNNSPFSAYTPLPEVVKGDVSDSAKDLKDLNVGDEISFGNYIRSTNMEPIKWTIYEKDDSSGKAFIIANQVIDSKEYDISGLNFPEWDTCTLRTWLNSDFYNTAFNQDEKAKIIETKVETYELFRDEPTITYDKVFVLSNEEVKKYFTAKEKRRCWGTPYAHAKGNDSVYWWIRNHSVTNKGQYVSETGVIYSDRVDNPERIGVRPALWVTF